MAALTITATSVVKGTDADVATDTAYAGEAITAGQTVYKHTDGLVYKADANDTAAKAEVKGVALNGGGTGQPIIYQKAGTITIGASLTVGEIYVQSITAGGIAPVADLASTHYTSIIGIATSASLLKLLINNSGVVHG